MSVYHNSLQKSSTENKLITDLIYLSYKVRGSDYLAKFYRNPLSIRVCEKMPMLVRKSTSGQRDIIASAAHSLAEA